MANSGPAGVFDTTWQAFWTKIVNTWHAAPWEKLLLTAGLLVLVIADILSMLVSMFFTFLVANFLLYLFIAAGPVFVVGLLFTSTHGFFRFWLDLIVAMLGYLLILDIMLGFFATVLIQLIDATGSATSPYTDMLPNLLGACIVITVLAAANGFLALQFGRMRGAAHDGIGSGFAMAVIAARTVARIV
jgi:type IV secretion system protein VirB6